MRESESRPGEFSMSIFDEKSVKHYRIFRLDEGGFFIGKHAIFDTLKELVNYYSQNSDGLCVNLRYSCPQPEKHQIDPSHKDIEIPHEVL